MAINRGYRLSPAANRDLVNIWRYTVGKWSIEQAEIYQDNLAATFEVLAAGLKIGRPVEIKRKGYLKHTTGAHMIYFRETKNEIIIVRILHGSQDAERHLGA